MAKPWEGRFSKKTDRMVELFTSSIDVDMRLYAYDIQGSLAHCMMLAKQSIISQDEADQIIQGLGEIKREIEHGDFVCDHALEDIHMHIENRLIQKIGKAAQKLHTARSRNDQVALDIRLYLRDETTNTINALMELMGVLVDLAEVNINVVLPGYTHLQRAQPVLFSHHMMAYYEMFKRDADRFADSFKRTNILPLGSAALAGTTFPIDRDFVAVELGFPAISENSMDAVSDRDFIIEFTAAASICMMHLSRFSEELITWSSSEFNFITLPDAFATGSSIMPQKKNPDVPELVRGKAGRVFGDLIALLTLMKSLPLAYNRDMQEDKPPLFDTVDTLRACIDIFTKMLPKLEINQEVMYNAASTGYLNATELADYLASNGVAFRKAHACAGKAVAYAIENNKELHELTLQELKLHSKIFKKEIFDFLTPEKMVERRESYGGTSVTNVELAIKAAKKALGKLSTPNESTAPASKNGKKTGKKT